jgi:DNA-binding transcriptional regulator YiaG
VKRTRQDIGADREAIATMIRNMRHGAGKSQAVVARELGLGTSAICHWERPSGTAVPNAINLLRFAALCGYDLANPGRLP